MLPDVIIAQAADMENDAFMSNMAGFDSPLRDEAAAGGGSGQDLSLPFHVYKISEDDSSIVFGITKGRINGIALQADSLQVSNSFTGGIYIKVPAFGNPSFYVSSSTPQDTENEGYIKIAQISNGTPENLTTTSFATKNCGSVWVCYAV